MVHYDINVPDVLVFIMCVLYVKWMVFITHQKVLVQFKFSAHSLYFSICWRQEELADYSWSAVLFKLYSKVFSKICPCCRDSHVYQLIQCMLGMWLQIGRKGPGVECKVRAQINSTLIHDCTISIFRGADAAFLAACWEVGSREWAVMLRRTCNNICVFWKHAVSVVQVYTHCIKCKTFQFCLAAENLVKWNESRAWSQVSVGRALVRYKWLHSL